MPEPVKKETPRIKGLFESGEKTPETAPEPVKPEVFEYRDSAGKVMAKVELSYGEEVVFKKGVKGRRLEKLMIMGEKDGQPTSLDVLSMVNTRNVNVVVSESGSSTDAFYVEDELAALVPKLETPTGFAVLLHELGHAEQYAESKFRSMSWHYRLGKTEKQASIPAMSRAELEGIVNDITANFPELPANLAAYELRELARLEPELREASSRTNDAEREHMRLKLDQRRIESGQLKEIFKQKIDLIETFMEFKDAEADPAALIGKLREIGIEVGPATVDSDEGVEEDVAESRDGSFVFGTEEHEPVTSERPIENRPLNETDVRTADDAAAIAFGIRSKLSSTGAKEVDWNEKDGQVTVKFISMLGHGKNPRREVTVRFAVDQETQTLMRKERDALLPAIESRRRLEAEAMAGLQNLESQRREIMSSSLIQEVVRTPKRLMERNATARAFDWANKIKKATGADLFRPHAVDPKLDMRKHLPDQGSDEECESTVMTAIDAGESPTDFTDIQEQLTAALRSHKDELPPVQKLRKAGQL